MFKKIFFSFCVIWTFAGIACVQAYEPEFVAFVDQHRPRLTDNPATISQLDEDYFEIEPPRPPSYDSDVNIQRLYYQDAGAVSNQVEYEKSTSAGIGLKFATRSFGITLRTDQTEYKHDKQYRFNSDNDSYTRLGLVLGTKLGPALVGVNFNLQNRQSDITHDIWKCTVNSQTHYLYYGDHSAPTEHTNTNTPENCYRIKSTYKSSFLKPTLGVIIPFGSFMVLAATHEPQVKASFERDNKSESNFSCTVSGDFGDSKACDFFGANQKYEYSEPAKTIYGVQLNFNFLENFSTKFAYDVGKITKLPAEQTFEGLENLNTDIKGQMAGVEFLKTIGVSAGSREFSAGSLTYRKRFANLNLKFFGGWNLSYNEILIKDNSGRQFEIKYPSLSYNVKFNLTGRRCDVWEGNVLKACDN